MFWPGHNANTLHVMQRCTDQCPTLQKNMAHILGDREIGAEEPLPADYLEPVKALWQDEGIRQTITKGNEYALHDNLA